MSFFRKGKIDRPAKEVDGEHKLPKDKSPRIGEDDPRNTMDMEDIREEAEQLQDLLELENTELLIDRLFKRARAKLQDLKVVPDLPTVRGALRTLNDGVPSELNLELLERAIDIYMDSYVHINGFDPVPVVLRCHEDPADIKPGDIPKAPMPSPLNKGPFGPDDKEAMKPMLCSEMANLDNIPEPEVLNEDTGEMEENPDFMTSPITVIIDKIKRWTLLDLLMKLMQLFVYFIAKFVRDFLWRYRNKKIIKKLVRPVIKKMEKIMRKAWCKITEECDQDDIPESQDILDYLVPDDITYFDVIDADDFENRGISCVEAAATVVKYTNDNMNENDAIYALLKAQEVQQYHEAQKHGMLMAMSDEGKYQEKVKELDASTMDKPRFRKRYGVCRKQFKKRLKKAGLFKTNGNN